MSEKDWLAEQFEARRAYLRAVALRMLGSTGEADDAIQEAWLRLSRTGAQEIENLGGWLTTVVARVCLDMLRRRKSRNERPLEANLPEPATSEGLTGPESEALLADSVGLALLVVLGKLTPPERVAFVLHDMFGVPFDEITPILERSPEAIRQLASRARRRVQGADVKPGTDRRRQRELVEAFLKASRQGDFKALLELLDPQVVLRADQAAAPPGAAREIHGAAQVVEQARLYARRARFGRVAQVNGQAGVVVVSRGHMATVLTFQVREGKIVQIDVIGEPQTLQKLEIAW